jgi:putative redox protein
MIEATALPTPYQVRFRSGGNAGLADTMKEGKGGFAGLRPHELLEAALASCMTMTARMALDTLGHPAAEVTVRVQLHRDGTASQFRYDVQLDRTVEDAAREVVLERVAACPVRRTLGTQLSVSRADLNS